MEQKQLPIFSERFALLRGNRTQGEFADLLGISRPTVGFYENGSRIPDAFVLRQIAEKCRVSADWLIGISDCKSMDFNVREISNISGISEETIESLILRKKHLDPLYMDAFNDFFSPICMQEILAYLWEIRKSTDTLKKIILSVSNEIVEIEAKLHTPDQQLHLHGILAPPCRTGAPLQGSEERDLYNWCSTGKL